MDTMVTHHLTGRIDAPAEYMPVGSMCGSDRRIERIWQIRSSIEVDAQGNSWERNSLRGVDFVSPKKIGVGRKQTISSDAVVLDKPRYEIGVFLCSCPLAASLNRLINEWRRVRLTEHSEMISPWVIVTKCAMVGAGLASRPGIPDVVPNLATPHQRKFPGLAAEFVVLYSSPMIEETDSPDRPSPTRPYLQVRRNIHAVEYSA
ncbi:MAG: hypothetical protein Q9193_005848 [Seirophora villosa]